MTASDLKLLLERSLERALVATRATGGALLLLQEGELRVACSSGRISDGPEADFAASLFRASIDDVTTIASSGLLIVPVAAGQTSLGAIYLEADSDFTEAERSDVEAIGRELGPKLAGDLARKAVQGGLSDLERKGFREVKVLRAGDINQLIFKAVGSALAREPGSRMSDEQRQQILKNAKTEVDRALNDAKRMQVEAQRLAAQREQLDEANAKLQDKVQELNKQFLAEKQALERERLSLYEQTRREIEERDARMQSLSDQVRRATMANAGFELTPEAIDTLFAQKAGLVPEPPAPLSVDAAMNKLRRLRGLPPTVDPAPSPSASEQLLGAMGAEESPLGGSLLLMAAQDGEIPAAEIAALEDRLEVAEPVLRAEWEWLARARSAVRAIRPAALPADACAALASRIRDGLNAPMVDARSRLADMAAKGFEVGPDELDGLFRALKRAVERTPAAEAAHAVDEREVAYRARLEGDVARWIQHMPLPERPVVGDLELAAAIEEAPGAASDGWGFVQHPDGELFAWICEVSGRGVEAACFLLEVAAAFRAAAAPGTSPAVVLRSVNRALARAEAQMFASATLVRWEPQARRLTLASGRQQDATHYQQRTRRAQVIRRGGVVLGIGARIPESVFQDHEVPFEPGDVLLLHTDGCVEVHGRSPEDEQRLLIQAFCQTADRPAREQVEALCADLAWRHGPPRHDDRALVVIRRR